MESKTLKGKVFFTPEEAETFRKSLKPEDFLGIHSTWFETPYQKNQRFAIVLIYLSDKASHKE